MSFSFPNKIHDIYAYSLGFQTLINKILSRPKDYLDQRDKWILLIHLLYLFGATFNPSTSEIYLQWGDEDYPSFITLRKLLSCLTRSNTKGSYNKATGI